METESPTPDAVPAPDPDAAPAAPRSFLGDRIGSGICVVLSVGVIVQSLFYGLQGKTQVVGAGLFPFILGIAFLVVAILWAWQAWRGTVPEPADDIEWPNAGGFVRIGITAGVLLASALVFELIDFRVTLFLAPFIVMRFVFAMGWIRSIAVALGITVACHFILLVGLGMPLPTF